MARRRATAEGPTGGTVLKMLRLGTQAGVLVYPRVLEIIAQKPDGKVYVHKFKTQVEAYGLSDGSVLLRSVAGLSLWDLFYRPTEE